MNAPPMRTTNAYIAVLHEGRWRVAEVTAGEAGYLPVGQPHDSYGAAHKTAAWLNRRAGLSANAVRDVLASALAAQEAADAAEFGA